MTIRPSTPMDADNFDELTLGVIEGFHDDEALTIDYRVERNDMLGSH